ncbi:leucine-rich repeat-containing protein 66 [Grus japonensis]|uniref:Beta-sarcoglycan n=1 Tax=Grus japonensis TaxID=30415 RepID=A0ABC9WTA8_GRUJA
MAAAASEQQSSNGPVKKSMREKAVERRNVNKEHNSNFKAGYIPIDEDRLHKTGLRGRKGNLAICVIVLLFILAVINLIITLVIWAVIRIGPNGCDSMEFHESGLLRFKQVSDMGVIHPLYKSTVGGRRNEDLVITGNNQPIVFQQGTTKLSVEKDKTSITSDIGMEFVDPRTQNTLFSTDYETHEFHLPNGVKILNVQKASTERITSNATSDLNIKVDGRAIVRGNEGVFITGKTIEFRMGGNMELKAENSIILNGTVMVSPSRLPSSSYGEQFNNGNWLRFKLYTMDNLHLSVIAVVLYFNLPGSVGTESQQILLDTHHHSDCRWDGEFSANCSFTGVSTIPEDVSQTATTADFSYNNIKTFMHTDERNDEWMLKHLNLSNNLISELSLTAFRNLPILETLNLNGNAIHTLTLDIPTPARESKKQGKSCHLLPALKVLSVEKNNLHAVPRGLGLLQSLQTVHLSSNGIRQIDLDDFQNCSQLKDIDLQNNKITKIHPDAFRDLNKLQVVKQYDDCFNETSTLYESVIDSSVHAPNTEEEYQKESNNEIYVKKKTVFSDIKTSINNYENTNVDDNGLYSVRTDYKNSSEVTPRKLMSNDISLWEDSKYANNEDSEKSRFPPVSRRLNADSYSNHTDSSDLDSSFTGKTGFPFSTTQTHTVAQDSRNSQVSNNSGLLQSEITKAPPESPEREGIVSHNEPMSITKFMPKRQSCDEQFGLNGNINITGDVGDFISPGGCKRGTNIENLSVYQTTENSPLREYDCKTECTNEKYTSADTFGDSSSDEGTPFTMSDCSSLADFELEQPGVSDNPPVCQSSVEEANMNSRTDKFSTLPESPNVAAELQHIGKHKDGNNGYFETTSNYGSDTITPERASPYADKCSDHISMSDSDTISSSGQEVPDTFDYFTNEESTVQYSDSLHNRNTDFGNTLLSLKHSPTYNTDTESAPEEAELQLYQLAIEPQHPLRFSPTEQKENAPEGSTDEHNDGNSSEKNHGEGDVTLRRNTSPSEDDDFIFAPIDTGLSEIVKKTSLLHSSHELSLQPLPEHTTEKHFTFITEKDDLLPQGKQVNTTKACADQLQRGFNEKDCDGYTELQDTSDWSLPKEMQSCSAMADLLHLHSSGKTRSVFNTGDHFQLDQSDEDGHSFSVPQSYFNESTRHNSHSFPQKTTGNTISESIDSSETEDDTTLTGLEKNFTTAGNLQNSSEKLSQKSQNNLGQGQFFVKKKRAFDGFANVLQSRRTNFNS